MIAFNWFTGKENRDTIDMDDEMMGMQTVGPIQPTAENDIHLNGTPHSSHPPSHSVGSSSRKNSVYVKSSVNVKAQKGQRLVSYTY